jgi:hypothetical protein
VSTRRRQFDMAVKRRREIEAHAKAVNAGNTDDLDRWLIAWVWNNPGSKDQIGAVIECARRLGRRLTNREAAQIVETACTTRCHRSADHLGCWLSLTYKQRQALGITTIGACDLLKRARTEQYRLRDRLAAARRRWERGAKPRSEALSRTRPWEALGISRRTWERRRQDSRTVADANSSSTSSPTIDANPSAAVFLNGEDEFASAAAKRTSDDVPSAGTVPLSRGGMCLEKWDWLIDCHRQTGGGNARDPRAKIVFHTGELRQ